MTTGMPRWMRNALSDPRLAPYLASAHGDPGVAARLYWWNTEVSGALYGPLHCLEVTLRNAMHAQLTVTYARADWWSAAPLSPDSCRLVNAARQKAGRRAKGPLEPPDSVMAELSFGFWAALLSRGSHSYDRLLWVPTLHKSFPHFSGRRAELYDNVSSLVLLRNRIMHYEPIHHRDLTADHAKIYRVLGYVSPRAVKEAQAMDRFPAILAAKSENLSGRRLPSF